MNRMPHSAVYRCLLVGELFQIVTDLLNRSHSKGSLASLAQVCKTFNEATIPTLWKFQTSLVPLLRLFPADTWMEVPHTRRGKVLQIMKPDKLEWTRFRHYAQHVRHLFWNDREDVSPLALEALSLYRPAGQPLLPRLRFLDWHDLRQPYFSYIHLFITPSLRRLEFTPPDFAPPDTIALLEHAGSTCPHLEELSIYSDDVDPDAPEFTGLLSDALVRLIRGLPELTDFKSGAYVSVDCVEALAQVPRLALLEMRILPEEMAKVAASAVCCAPEGRPFSELETLSLMLEEMGASSKTFLGSVRSSKVYDLFIQCFYQPETHVVKEHLDAATRAPYGRSLVSLQLDLEHPEFEDDPVPVLDVGEALQPLYASPHLYTVVVKSHALFTRAETLKDIANAWRDLGLLSIVGFLPHPEDVPCASLAALAPLARQCLTLHTLELHLNAEVVPSEEDTARLLPQPSQCRLSSLTVLDAPIGSGQGAAGFLQKLFPRIHKVEHCGWASLRGDGRKAFDKKWKCVHGIVSGERGDQEISLSSTADGFQ